MATQTRVINDKRLHVAFHHHLSPPFSLSLEEPVLSLGRSRRTRGHFLSQYPRLSPPSEARVLGALASFTSVTSASLRSPPGAAHGVSDHDPFEDLASPVMLLPLHCPSLSGQPWTEDLPVQLSWFPL